jgi:hypothetical protein
MNPKLSNFELFLGVLIVIVESNHADLITAHKVRTCGGRLCCGLWGRL